ncbi:hypothetical protein POTOM_054549 [Populus tomentosa]|uniref:Uncharacterized protein n=1 Tax=Populus tomentosa TaxID=118781 RepID=A0A8X7XZF0_POPTO|nr:hypothetical protein POTOM_054549 [Populus tomentosa]
MQALPLNHGETGTGKAPQGSSLNCSKKIKMITTPFHILLLCLAMALYDSVTCGKASKKKDLADEDSEPKQRREWNDLVLNEGTELIQLKANYGDLVPFVDGLKTIEERMASGAVILFNKCVASGSGDNNYIQTSYAFFLQFGFLITSSQQDFHRHASFFEMLEAGP